jgi:hypothetical protein
MNGLITRRHECHQVLNRCQLYRGQNIQVAHIVCLPTNQTKTVYYSLGEREDEVKLMHCGCVAV